MMPHAELVFESGAVLSPRRFSVREPISDLFSVTVEARVDDAGLDLKPLVGRPAGFRLRPDVPGLAGAARAWTGICRRAEQSRPEADGLATYSFHVVPTLWLLTQRVNHRIFQHVSIPEIADRIFAEWRVPPTWRIDRGAYPRLEYKVQYGETDMAFVARLLEEAGITFFFEDDGARSALVLSDEPHGAEARGGQPIPFVEHHCASSGEFLTAIRHGREIRPGAWVLRDHDFRRPTHVLSGVGRHIAGPEARLEQFHYQPGAFVIDTAGGGSTPVADDRGAARHDDAHGKLLAERALAAARTGDHSVSFDTNVLDLRPGVVFATLDHPHPAFAPGRDLLVTSLSIDGEGTERCTLSGQAVFKDRPYRPARRTPRPKIGGVHPAIVVGPKGQQIHTDELGRVRVQFPWDREGKGDDGSSCWIRTSQGWAGRHHGWLMLPRVGHEVLVEFLDGDPDRPILAGRVYNAAAPVPYKLPDHKTVSTWKSDSSPGSGGFNEIKYEDRKGAELFYVQAEKNLRSLVKHDDTSTVLRHREKTVQANEIDTTGVNRIEVTGVLRTEATGAERITFVGGDKRQRIFGDEIERTEGSRMLRVGMDVDWVVAGTRREFIGRDRKEKKQDEPKIQGQPPHEGQAAEEEQEEETLDAAGAGDEGAASEQDEAAEGEKEKETAGQEKREEEEMQSPLHQEVKGNRSERIDGMQSLTIALDQFEKVLGRHALSAGRRIHLLAGENLMAEAPSITFKGKGGFLKIDATGVTIKGKLVKINVGGSPGKGRGSHPRDPEKAAEADAFGGPLLRLAKTAQARVQKVAQAVASGVPVPGLAMGITFEGTGKLADIYKLAKGTPEREALMVLLGQGRKVAQIRQILASGTNFQKRLFKKGDKLFGFVSSGGVGKGGSGKSGLGKSLGSPYWLDEATFDKLKAAHFKDGVWDSQAVQQALGLPATNTADAVVVAEVTEDHEGLSSVVLPVKARLFGKDGDGARWKQTVSMGGGVVQVTPGPKWLEAQNDDPRGAAVAGAALHDD